MLGVREKSERQSKSEEVVRERESQRKLRKLERNLWLRELVDYRFFFFFYVTKHCNFVNIIRVN